MNQDLQNQLAVWEEFARTKRHILDRGDEEWSANKILLQLACEHADGSPVTEAAEAWLQKDQCDWLWMRKMRRPEQFIPDPCVRVFEGHTSFITGAIQLMDGRILSWSKDDTVRVWEIDSGRCVVTINDSHDCITSPKQLCDGRILTWRNRWRLPSSVLKIWDEDTGELLFTLEADSCVDGALQLEDGRILSWFDDHNLRLWDATTGRQLGVWTIDKAALEVPHLWRVYEGQVAQTRFKEPSNSRILSYDDDTIQVSDANTGESLAILKGHTGLVFGAQQLADGRILSWSSDATLRLWDVNAGQNYSPHEECTGSVDNAHIRLKEPKDDRIISFHGDIIQVSDADTGECLTTLEGHAGSVWGVRQLSGGRILSWSRDGTMRIWNAVTGECLIILVGHPGCMDAKQLKDGRILSWAGPSYRLIETIDKGDTLRLWDVDTGECLAILKGHTGMVNGAIQLEDGRILSWSNDGTLRLWNAKTGECSAILIGHTGSVFGAQQLPDGRILSWSGDGPLRLWDAESGECLATLQGHTCEADGAMQLENGQILSWSVAPSWLVDGHFTSHKEDILRLWNANTGQQLGVWELDKAAFEVPNWWRAYKSQVSPNTLAKEAVADQITRGIICVFPELKLQVLWQGEGGWKALHLLSEGKIAISCHKQFEFLSLYSGRRRVTLAQAHEILQNTQNN